MHGVPIEQLFTFIVCWGKLEPEIRLWAGKKMKKQLQSIFEKVKDAVTDPKELSRPIEDAGKKIGEAVADVKEGLVNRIVELKAFLEGDLISGVKSGIESVGGEVCSVGERVVGAMLTSSEVHRSILEYLGQFHNHAGENPIIRESIDKLGHVAGYGGAAFHRISDGRHSFLGALEAVSRELPEVPMIERITGVYEHLWHDFHSKAGLPLIAFSDHESFIRFCEALHLSPKFLRDFLTVNSTELLASALTIVPVLFRMDKMEAQDFAKVATRVGIYTAAGGHAEAVGSVFALAMLGKSFFEAHHAGESYLQILKEAAKEGGWTAASVTSFILLPLPVSMSVSVALSIIHAKVEKDGLDAVMENSREYFESLGIWVRELNLEGLVNLRS